MDAYEHINSFYVVIDLVVLSFFNFQRQLLKTAIRGRKETDQFLTMVPELFVSETLLLIF